MKSVDHSQGVSPASWREYLKPARATGHRLPIFARFVELIQPKRNRFWRALAGRELYRWVSSRFPGPDCFQFNSFMTGYRFAMGHLQRLFLRFLVIQESGASLVCPILYIPGMMTSVKWAN